MPYVLKISLIENFCRALAEIFCNWKYVSTKFFDDDFIDYVIFGHEILQCNEYDYFPSYLGTSEYLN